MANIISITQMQKPSDYGQFNFPIFDIDTPIVTGGTLSVVAHAEYFSSCFITRGSSSSVTNSPLPTTKPATANIDNVKGWASGIFLNLESANGADSGALVQNNAGEILRVYRGTNGACVSQLYSAVERDNNDEKSTVVAASSNKFGSYFITLKNDVYNNISFGMTVTQAAIDFATDLVTGTSPIEPEDPFAPGGTAEPGGGNGTFNGTSDSNPIPGDPAISATDTGFMTVFATNVAGLRSLAESLWTDVFSAIQPGGTLEETVKSLKNIVASPYDAILGCHIVPVTVPTGTSRNVKMYGVLPSEVSLPVASSQWVHKDCGSLTIQPYDGSYLDYAPYSKVTSLYLPFVGVVSVDIDIIMNTTIGVYYKIDIVSGQCIVYVTKNGDVYFQYQGQCAVPIPVTSIDWSTTVSSGLGLIGSVTGIVGSAVGGFSGGPAGVLGGAVKGTMENAGAMAQNVMNSKPDIKAGSGVGGAAALMGCKSPYLIIERPRKSTPARQNHYTGYPSNIRAKLGDLSGYTEVSRVYVNHMSATQEEKEEIETLLNGGVIL